MHRVPVSRTVRLATVGNGHLKWDDKRAGGLAVKEARRTGHRADGPAVVFARVGVDRLRRLDNASRRLLVECSGDDRPTLLSASEDGRSVDHGLELSDKPRGRLLVKDERTADRRTTRVGGLSVKNDLPWAHKSCCRVILRDREKRFAPPPVGLASVDSKTLDVADDDRLLGLVEDDGSADEARASHR